MNDPEALDDPEAVGGLKTAANLEALGVKAKHKSHGVKAKHKFRGTWNQKVEDDLEDVNDPEALDDPEVAKQKFRGCEAQKQNQVELGTQKVEDDLKAVNDPEAVDDPEAVENDLEAVSHLEAMNDPEALDDPEVVDDPEAVADPRTVWEWKKIDRIVLVGDKDDLGFEIHLLVDFYCDNNSGRPESGVR
nr:beta-1,4-glucuronyltransferase 1 [Ipomoea batatas]